MQKGLYERFQEKIAEFFSELFSLIFKLIGLIFSLLIELIKIIAKFYVKHIKIATPIICAAVILAPVATKFAPEAMQNLQININNKKVADKIENTKYFKDVLYSKEDKRDVCIIKNNYKNKISDIYRISKDKLAFIEPVFDEKNMTDKEKIIKEYSKNKKLNIIPNTEDVRYESALRSILRSIDYKEMSIRNSPRYTYKVNYVTFDMKSKKYKRVDLYPELKKHLDNYKWSVYDFKESSLVKDKKGETYVRIPICSRIPEDRDEAYQRAELMYNIKTHKYKFIDKCDNKEFFKTLGTVKQGEKEKWIDATGKYMPYRDRLDMDPNVMKRKQIIQLLKYNVGDNKELLKQFKEKYTLHEANVGYGDIILSANKVQLEGNDEMKLFKMFPELKKYINNEKISIDIRLASIENSDGIIKLFMKPDEAVTYKNVSLSAGEKVYVDKNTNEVFQYKSGGVQKDMSKDSDIPISTFNDYKKYSYTSPTYWADDGMIEKAKKLETKYKN